jgi:hypothetical protein
MLASFFLLLIIANLRQMREPRQYMEGRESFHLVAETDEMYRAWCADATQAARTVRLLLPTHDTALYMFESLEGET